MAELKTDTTTHNKLFPALLNRDVASTKVQNPTEAEETHILNFILHSSSHQNCVSSRGSQLLFFGEGGDYFFFPLNVTLVTTELLHIHYVCFPRFTTSYLTDLSLWQKDSCVKNSSVLLGEERCLPAHRALLH